MTKQYINRMRNILIAVLIFFLLPIISAVSIFNNSLSSENLTFTGNQNITRYLAISNTSIFSGYINLSGSELTLWQEIGSTNKSSGNPFGMTAMNDSDMALVDTTTDSVYYYSFNGINYTQVGNAYKIGSITSGSLTVLNNSDIAYLDGSIDRLRRLSWNGTDWNQIGLNTTETSSAPRLTTFNSSRIVVADTGTNGFKVYDWVTNNWTLAVPKQNNVVTSDVGNYMGITALNESDIAIATVDKVDGNKSMLYTLTFNGTNWTQVGNQLSVPNESTASNTPYRAVSKINSTRIVFYGNMGSIYSLKIFDWNGTDWSQVGTSYKSSVIYNIMVQSVTETVTMAAGGTTSIKTITVPKDIPSNPTNPSLLIGDTNVWDYSGSFTSAIKTNDFSTALANYLLICSFNGGYCYVPFTFHSDSIGELEYSQLNVTQYITPSHSGENLTFNDGGDIFRYIKIPFSYIGKPRNYSVVSMSLTGYDLGNSWYPFGNSYSMSGVSYTTLTALNNSDIAFADGTLDKLRRLSWNGTDWNQIGNNYSLTTASPAITALNETRIAFSDATYDLIGTFDFNGTDWSQVGNNYNFPSNTIGPQSITALNETRIAFSDATYDYIRTFDFNGTDWSQVGNNYSISGLSGPTITALNETRIAFIDLALEYIGTFDFNGTDWSQVGNNYSVSGISSGGITALNETRIAFSDSPLDMIRTFDFNGTDWSQVGNNYSMSGISSQDITTLNETRIAFIDSNFENLMTFDYSRDIPTNPYLLLGDTNVWNYTGAYNETETADFTTALNTYLETCTVGYPPDDNYCYVPFTFHSDRFLKDFTGTITQLEYTNLNFTEWFYTENSQTYNSSTFETSTETFILNLTINEDYSSSLSQATLVYNEIPYVVSNTGSGNNAIFEKQIDAPLIEGESQNISFHWEFVLSNEAVGLGTHYFNTTTYNQTVNQTLFALCNDSINLPNTNLTFINNYTNQSKNATIVANFIYYLGSGAVQKNYSYSNSTFNPNYNFCVNSPSTYFIDYNITTIGTQNIINGYYYATSINGSTNGLITNISLVPKLEENSQTYSSSISETANGTFILNITETEPLTAYLYYDNVNMGTYTTVNSTGEIKIISKNITIPTINSSSKNNSFYWLIGLTNSTGTFYYNSTTKYQIVNAIVPPTVIIHYPQKVQDILNLNATVTDVNLTNSSYYFTQRYGANNSGSGDTFNFSSNTFRTAVHEYDDLVFDSCIIGCNYNFIRGTYSLSTYTTASNYPIDCSTATYSNDSVRWNATQYVCVNKSGELMSLQFLINDTPHTNNIVFKWDYYNYTNLTNMNATSGVPISFNISMPTKKNITIVARDIAGNINFTSFDWNNVPLFIYNVTYSSSAYETSSQTFALNLSYLNNSYSGISTNLIYDGTSYSGTQVGTGGDLIFNRSISIPTITEATNKSFYWAIGLTNSTGTFYFNTTTYNQTVNPISFGLCNATLTTNYLNVTFLDEGNLAQINATMDASTWTYSLSNGGANKTYVFLNATHNPEYDFCFTPTDKTITVWATLQYSSTSGGTYPQKTYYISNRDYTNSTTKLQLYLLNYDNGVTSNYQVISVGNQVISGAHIIVTRTIGANTTTVAEGYTDASGQVSFFLNPNYDHTFTVTATGYTSQTITIKPSQSQYTITMGGSTNPFYYSSSVEGMTYSIWPPSGIILNGMYNFTLKVDSGSKNNIINCSMKITFPNGTVYGSATGCGSSGGTIGVYLNVTPTTLLYGQYWVTFTNNTVYYIERDAMWKNIHVINTGGTSIKDAIKDLIDMPEWGDCPEGYSLNKTSNQCYDNLGNISERYQTADFNRIVFFFLFLAILMAALNFFTSYDTAYPGAFVYLMWIFITIASAVNGWNGPGYFYLNEATNENVFGYFSDVLNNWIVWLNFTMLMAIYFFTTNRRYSSG